MTDPRPNERQGSSPVGERPATRLSPWSIAALLFSLAVFCPVMTLLGPVLGVKALADIRTRPGTSGAAPAIAAIVIGLAVTLLWGGAAWWWNGAVRQPLLEGPRQPLMQGQLGDVVTFQAAFHGEGADLDPAFAQSFLAEMTSRYGVLRNVMQDHFTAGGSDAPPGQLSSVVPYVLQFESDLVRAEADFVLFEPGFAFLDPRTWSVAATWRSIVILDDEAGDLAYPPGATRRSTDETSPHAPINGPEAGADTDADDTDEQ